MSSIRKYPLPWTTVFTASTTAAFLPATAWMQASEVDKLRVTWELRGRTGNLEVTAGYQTADVENNPDSATAIGSYVSSDGMTYPSSGFTSVSANTEGKQLVRFGWMCKNSTGTDDSLGRVAGVVEVVEC
ncbi:MAG: hypothetical protein H6739_15605 [Alphaproteobacteria bacterium]|nr:hypothetical protein [Alphaproteobacteria bacterium]